MKRYYQQILHSNQRGMLIHDNAKKKKKLLNHEAHTSQKYKEYTTYCQI